MRPVAIAALLWLLPAGASADVIMPVTIPCPPGAQVQVGHGLGYCAPTTCVERADCHAPYGVSEARFDCAPAGLCVRTQQAFAGRGGRITIDVALRACANDADCGEDGPCRITDRCLRVDAPADPDAAPPPPPVPGAPPPAGSCGGGGPTTFALLVLLVALGGVAQRRARGRALEAARVAVRDRVHAGPATHSELLAITADAAHVDRALAPLAGRLRVEANAEGELVYRIDEDDERAARGVDRLRG